MGSLKDEMMRKEEARDNAAHAKGRVCVRCGATIPFDDAEPTSDTMLCAYCRHTLEKDE